MATAWHIILPSHRQAEAKVLPRETVARLLRRLGWRFALPTICTIDGTPLLRRDRGWKRRRIRRGEAVQFLSRPMGGGAGSGGNSTKSVIGLVGLIALSALAPGIGQFAAGALLSGTALAASTTFAATAISGAIVAGGAFALNTLLRPSSAASAQDAQPTLYAFGQQSNQARPLQPIPLRYGRTKVTPDFAAQPWTEYVGQDEYLNVLLVHGLGRYQRHRITIADAVLWDADSGLSSNFTDVQIQTLEPGDTLTLFPAGVITAGGVSGQQLDDPAVWTYGGIINPAGTSVTRLVFDFVLPQGCYVNTASGGVGQYATHVQVRVRPVNSAGAPTGDWTVVVDQARWLSTKAPYRMSYEANVSPGRYEVSARRVVPLNYVANAVDTINWAGARGYLPSTQTFPGLTVTAVRMRANSQLTAGAALKWGLEDTRIVRVWTGSGWDEQPSRNPAYAFLDLATDTDYGCSRPLSKVDVQAVTTLAGTATLRGDRFDYEFRARTMATEALDTILAACRAKHRWLGDMLSVVRDEWVALPSMMLTDGEIIRDSLSVDYLLQSEDAADAVIAEYIDETTSTLQEVQVPADVVAENPVRVQLKGIVQRDHAARDANFLWRQNTIRRQRPTLTVEREGRLLSLGSVITVQSHIPRSWGASGEVVSRDGLSLTLHKAPAWGTGQHYIKLRQRTGKPFGPIKVSRGGSDAIAVLDAADLALVEGQQGQTLAQVMTRAPGADGVSFSFGPGTAWVRRCIVLGGSPAGQNRTRLSLVVDRQDVHDDAADPGTVPPSVGFSNPPTPLVYGLVANLTQNVLEPVLSADWWPSAGALYYQCEISYDGGTTWAPLADVTPPRLAVVVEPRGLRLSVAAVGSSGVPGARTVVDLAAPVISADNLPLELNAQAVRELIGRQLGEAGDALEAYKAEQSALLADVMARIDDQVQTGDRALRTYYNVQVVRLEQADAAQVAQITTLQTSTGEAFASVTETLSSLTTSTLAIASSVSDLEAQLGDVEASLKVEWIASATPAGALASYQMRAKAEDSAVGFYMVAQSGGTGYVAIEADKFFIRSSAGTNFALFDTVGGALYLKGSLYADGSITGQKLAAQTVQASNLVLGGITFDRLALQAATNYVASYTEGSTTANPFKSTTLSRISGTAVDIMLSFEVAPFNISLPNIGGTPTVTLPVIVERVAPGGAVTTILNRRVPMTVSGYAASPASYYATVSLPFYSIPFTDFASVSEGSYTYNLRVDGAEYQSSSGTATFNLMTYGSVRYSYLKTSEFRR